MELGLPNLENQMALLGFLIIVTCDNLVTQTIEIFKCYIKLDLYSLFDIGYVFHAF